LILANYI